MPKISAILKLLGLTEKEAKIFITLTKLGPSSVSSIAGESGITRTHVYEIAEDMQKKGLLTKMEVRGVRKYEAIDHAGLLAYVSRKQKSLQGLEKDLIKSASDFNRLAVGEKQKTKVRFFEGPDGIKNIYDEIHRDLAKQKDPYEVFTIFSPGQLEKVMPDWIKSEMFIKGGTGMDKKAILYPSGGAQDYIEAMKKSQGEHSYKLWPKDSEDFPTDTISWLGKIMYIDLSDYPSGIIIENQAIKDSFKMWFKQMWQNL